VPTCGLSRWNVEIWDAHEHGPFQNLTIAKTEQLNGQGHIEGKIYKAKTEHLRSERVMKNMCMLRRISKKE